MNTAYREMSTADAEAVRAMAEPASSPPACAIGASGRRNAKTACTPCESSRIPIVLVITGLVLFFLVLAAGIYSALIR